LVVFPLQPLSFAEMLGIECLFIDSQTRQPCGASNNSFDNPSFVDRPHLSPQLFPLPSAGAEQVKDSVKDHGAFHPRNHQGHQFDLGCLELALSSRSFRAAEKAVFDPDGAVSPVQDM
jgi:hypothetical protein